MTGLLAFDADQHLGDVAPLAIQRGVRIFLPYYKLFSTADRDAIFAAGKAAGVQVGIIPIFETTAERGLQGAAAGQADGLAIANYMKACGQPPQTAYVLTFDFDEQAAQDPACQAYASAVQNALPTDPMIAYGNGALTEMLKSARIAKFSWDAGGMGMRGTRVDVQAGKEDMEQDVGDVRGLNLGISIDSDFAPNAISPADLDAWMDSAVPNQATLAVPPQVQPSEQAQPVTSRDRMTSLIKALQTELTAEGYNPGPIDGDPGPQTWAALEKWR